MKYLKLVFAFMLLFVFLLDVSAQNFSDSKEITYEQKVSRFEIAMEFGRDNSKWNDIKQDYQNAIKSESTGKNIMKAGGIIAGVGMLRAIISDVGNAAYDVATWTLNKRKTKTGMLVGGLVGLGLGCAIKVGARNKKEKIIDDYFNSGIGYISVPEKNYVKTISKTGDGLTLSMQF